MMENMEKKNSKWENFFKSRYELKKKIFLDSE